MGARPPLRVPVLSRCAPALLISATLLSAGCSCRGAQAPDAASHDSGDPTTAHADTGEDCTPETAEFVDWMAPGPHAAGRTLYAGTTDLRGTEMPLDVQITYPASADGDDTPLADGGPFPVIFFEHAYGADYLNSDWLLDRLASRGFIVFSAGHNGAWDSAGDWWGDHAALFDATADLAADWSGDADSPLYRAIDFETAALMGHSHGGGAALQAMAGFDVDAVVLITVRPSLDGAYTRYHEVYDGMPPMLNIVASRDEDGTTAYGTSVGVYEALTRPRFMVTVEGASHYTFTDEASIAPSSIAREAGQTSGGSAIIAFLEYMLHDDGRGVHSLRGDVHLFDHAIGAPTRDQSHLDDVLVIDDFEATISAEGTAIAGINGQTYVNGFLGDTFADLDAGVALLSAEVEALSDDGDSVLFYQDASRSTDAYAIALASLDRAVVFVSSDEDFASALDGDWDLVVATQQDGNTSDTRPFDAALAAWICDGGHAILSDFRTASATAADTLACAGAAFDGTNNWTSMTSQSDLFTGDMRVQNTSWGTFSTGLWTTETVFASNNTTTQGVPDPTLGPLGSVSADGPVTFDEVSALDPTRALTMPTNALELAWDAPSAVRWDFSTPLDARPWQSLSLRALQLHDDPLNDPLNDDGYIVFTVELEDTAASTAAQHVRVGPTLDWLETTTPKSVFETFRLPLAGFSGVDTSRLAALTIRLDGSASGRLLIDDIELSPGLECAER